MPTHLLSCRAAAGDGISRTKHEPQRRAGAGLFNRFWALIREPSGSGPLLALAEAHQGPVIEDKGVPAMRVRCRPDDFLHANAVQRRTVAEKLAQFVRGKYHFAGATQAAPDKAGQFSNSFGLNARLMMAHA